jgi:hypothetical protein
VVDLSAIAVLEALAANTAVVTRLQETVDSHQRWHRRAFRNAVSVAGLVSGLMGGAIVWGATQWRSGVESATRDQCRAVAIAQVEQRASEHSELRARDQSISNELVKLGRELQRIAQLPMKQDPDRVTR